MGLRAALLALLLVGLLAGCGPQVERPAGDPAARATAATGLLPVNSTLPPEPAAAVTSTRQPEATVAPTTVLRPTATPGPAASATPTAAIPPTMPPETEAPTPLSPAPAVLAEPPADPALVEAGIQVYLHQYCGVCHRLDAARTTGMFGPEQNGIGTRAAQRLQEPNYTGTAATAAEYIRESILNPQVYLVEGYEQSRHKMPAFTHLSEADLDALVIMLLQQK